MSSNNRHGKLNFRICKLANDVYFVCSFSTYAEKQMQ